MSISDKQLWYKTGTSEAVGLPTLPKSSQQFGLSGQNVPQNDAWNAYVLYKYQRNVQYDR